jgi:hypothetical protein
VQGETGVASDFAAHKLASLVHTSSEAICSKTAKPDIHWWRFGAKGTYVKVEISLKFGDENLTNGLFLNSA